MANFDKSVVDVAELSEAEVKRVLRVAGFGEATEVRKLTNGGCAANYACVLAGKRVVLKACVGPAAADLAQAQLDVLAAVSSQPVGPAPLYAGADVKPMPCVTTKGLAASAITMEYLEGEPLNLLIRSGRIDKVQAMAALGDVLARLSRSSSVTPAGFYDVATPGYIERYVRCPEPVETHASGSWAAIDPEFTAWALTHLPAARNVLCVKSLPRGLLHGDPFLDNVMFDGGVARLVDWEDSCVGPFVFDVACAAVGGCFDGEAHLDEAALLSLVRGYSARRPFSPAERNALRPLMLANALATAIYRFYTFNVVDDTAPAEAKMSYVEMRLIVEKLADTKEGATFDALLSKAFV